MGWSIHAFAESIALTVAPLSLNAVPDQILPAQGNELIIGKNNILLGGAAIMGAAIANNYVRLISPELRKIMPHNITPISTGIVPVNVDHKDLDNYNLRKLAVNEPLTNEAGGAIVAIGQKAIIVYLADQEIQEVYGEIISARCQVTVAQAVDAWTLSTAFNFIDNLPIGNYNVVGAEMVIPGGIAFRLLFNAQVDRPGDLCKQLPTDLEISSRTRRGKMGVWGQFLSTILPQVEVLGSAAAVSATYEGTIDLMRVS